MNLAARGALSLFHILCLWKMMLEALPPENRRPFDGRFVNGEPLHFLRRLPDALRPTQSTALM